MSLSQLDQHILAYYLGTAAQDLTIAPRFYPYGEMILIIEDKMQVATRKFGSKVSRSAKNAAGVFMDQMIEREAFSTVKNEFGGTMHQFQGEAYRQALKALQDANPIIAEARSAGPDFWPDAFAGVTA